MKYLDDGIPMDFNQDSTIIKSIKNKNPQLADKYIGISLSKEQLVAFTIDPQNHISAILMAVTWKLYNF